MPRKPVDPLGVPNVTPAARPVDTFASPSVERPGILGVDLRAVQGLSQTLNQFLALSNKAHDEKALTEARSRLDAELQKRDGNIKALRQAISKGEIDETENPFFQIAYQEASADNRLADFETLVAKRMEDHVLQAMNRDPKQNQFPDPPDYGSIVAEVEKELDGNYGPLKGLYAQKRLQARRPQVEERLRRAFTQQTRELDRYRTRQEITVSLSRSLELELDDKRKAGETITEGDIKRWSEWLSNDQKLNSIAEPRKLVGSVIQSAVQEYAEKYGPEGAAGLLDKLEELRLGGAELRIDPEVSPGLERLRYQLDRDAERKNEDLERNILRESRIVGSRLLAGRSREELENLDAYELAQEIIKASDNLQPEDLYYAVSAATSLKETFASSNQSADDAELIAIAQLAKQSPEAADDALADLVATKKITKAQYDNAQASIERYRSALSDIGAQSSSALQQVLGEAYQSAVSIESRFRAGAPVPELEVLNSITQNLRGEILDFAASLPPDLQPAERDQEILKFLSTKRDAVLNARKAAIQREQEIEEKFSTLLKDPSTTEEQIIDATSVLPPSAQQKRLDEFAASRDQRRVFPNATEALNTEVGSLGRMVANLRHEGRENTGELERKIRKLRRTYTERLAETARENVGRKDLYDIEQQIIDDLNEEVEKFHEEARGLPDRLGETLDEVLKGAPEEGRERVAAASAALSNARSKVAYSNDLIIQQFPGEDLREFSGPFASLRELKHERAGLINSRNNPPVKESYFRAVEARAVAQARSDDEEAAFRYASEQIGFDFKVWKSTGRLQPRENMTTPQALSQKARPIIKKIGERLRDQGVTNVPKQVMDALLSGDVRQAATIGGDGEFSTIRGRGIPIQIPGYQVTLLGGEGLPIINPILDESRDHEIDRLVADLNELHFLDSSRLVFEGRNVDPFQVTWTNITKDEWKGVLAESFGMEPSERLLNDTWELVLSRATRTTTKNAR